MNSLRIIQSVVYDINDAGDSVGTVTYNDGQGTFGFFGATVGFLLRGGVYTIINPPGSFGSDLFGINNAGDIVGIAPSNPGFEGFLYSNGTFTPVRSPDGTAPSWVSDINNAGQILGVSNNGEVFILTGDTYTIRDIHVSGTPFGFNTRGDIVGRSGGSDGNSFGGFLSTETDFFTFYVPDPQGNYTEAWDINDLGQIAGWHSFRKGFVTTFTGSSPTDPLLPNSILDGVLTFMRPVRGLVYDPPFAEGFVYTLTGGGTFTEVGVPPASFGFGPVQVVVGGTILATLDPGEHFGFNPGVVSFTLQGISPLVDAALATAFPTFLDFIGTPSSLTMTALVPSSDPNPSPIPEPSTWLLLATGLLGLLGTGYWQRCRAA